MPRWTRRQALALPVLGLYIPGWAQAAANWDGKPRLLEGPMLGPPTPDSAVIWARVGGPYRVRAICQDADGRAYQSSSVTAAPDQDFCVNLLVPGLKAGTCYRYGIEVENRTEPYLDSLPSLRLRTAPNGPAQFSVGFGSCCKFQDDPVQHIWNGVTRAEPDLFFWLGDNIYADTLHGHVIAETYRRQRAVVSLQPLLHSVPHLAVWDDHDFGLNDHDRRNPVKDEALRQFQRYWANPVYGLADVPGVFFQYSYGGVDFFFLDCRYHRDPNDAPDGPDKTMLGKAQIDWLKSGLKASQAPFKILISGSGWTKAKGMGGDSWASFIHERDSLFGFIAKEKIPGVVLLSGDTHVGELNCIPWSDKGGYDFYDLVSSPLAQKPEAGSWLARRPEIRIRQVYFRSNNFGHLAFDMTAPTPVMSFSLRDGLGQVTMAPLHLTADELTPGRLSWPEKIDSISLARHHRLQAGKSYYESLE